MHHRGCPSATPCSRISGPEPGRAGAAARAQGESPAVSLMERAGAMSGPPLPQAPQGPWLTGGSVCSGARMMRPPGSERRASASNPQQASAGSERTALEWAAKHREGQLRERPGFSGPASMPTCLHHGSQARAFIHRQRQEVGGLHPSCPDGHCGVLGERGAVTEASPCHWRSFTMVSSAASKHRPLNPLGRPEFQALDSSTCPPSAVSERRVGMSMAAIALLTA